MSRLSNQYPSGEKVTRSITMDKLLNRKNTYLASYESRSASSQIIYSVRDYIARFEREHGPITLEELEAFEAEQEQHRSGPRSKRHSPTSKPSTNTNTRSI